MKELPDPDGQSTIRSRVSEAWSWPRSVNRLANPRVITSANIQNGFGENEEDEKHVLYRVYQ